MHGISAKKPADFPGPPHVDKAAECVDKRTHLWTGIPQVRADIFHVSEEETMAKMLGWVVRTRSEARPR